MARWSEYGAIRTSSRLPSESSWSYWAGVAWLVIAGIGTIFVLFFAITILGLPIAAGFMALWVAPAVFFSNCFLTYRSQAGAAVATVSAALGVVTLALNGATSVAPIALLIEGVSLLGFVDLHREELSLRRANAAVG